MRLDYPNARGTLSAPLSKSARTVQFNADLEALLVNLLEGDWTYLLVRNDFGESEVIKLAVELGQRVVYRAQDYTCATAFQQGDTVEYVFTTEHALVELPKFQLYVTGAATLEEYTIGYKLPSFEHVGSAEVVASGDDIILGRNSQAYGCCDGGGAGAVSIEEPYIYLTSRMYPFFVMEPGITGGMRFIASTLWDMQIDNLESLGVVFYEGSMWGSTKSHVQPPEDAITGNFQFFEGSMWGAAIAHVQPAEDAIRGALVVFYEAVLYGGQIAHVQPAEDAITGSARFTEAALI